MRVTGLAFVGLMVGAFMASPASLVSASSMAAPASAVSLNQFFSSDAPESVHEAKNQGTMDEPKAWPEANAWLHAQLSDAERDFLALEATGTVDPNANLKGGLTDAQITDGGASITVTVRVTLAQTTPADLTSFRSAVIASIPLSSSNSVSSASASPAIVNYPSGTKVFSTLTFSFSSNGGSNTAGQQFVNFASQFAQATSALRTSAFFANNIDLNAFPTAVFVAGTTPTQAVTPTTAPVGYCTANPTTCLNGGSCFDSGQTFTCACATGFIGTNCQFSLIGANRRASASRLTRGKSVTRPKPKVA